MSYVIVNKASGRPIFAIGFCVAYTDKAEAEKAAEVWNKNRLPSTCEVKVVESKQ
jgi:hypothetical protein